MKAQFSLLLLGLLSSIVGYSQDFTPIDSIYVKYNSSASTLSGYLSGHFHVYGEIDSLTTSELSDDTVSLSMYYAACSVYPMAYYYDTAFTFQQVVLDGNEVVVANAVLNDPMCDSTGSPVVTDTAYFVLHGGVTIIERATQEAWCRVAGTQLYVEGGDLQEVVSIQIVDLQGQVFHFDSPRQYPIDISNCKPGIYLLSIHKDDRVECMKFVIGL